MTRWDYKYYRHETREVNGLLKLFVSGAILASVIVTVLEHL